MASRTGRPGLDRAGTDHVSTITAALRRKSQAPKPKSQTISKLQFPNRCATIFRVWDLGFPPSMAEVPDAGKDHRHFAFVGSCDHFLVPDRAARLNRTSGAGVGGRD